MSIEPFRPNKTRMFAIRQMFAISLELFALNLEVLRSSIDIRIVNNL